MWANTKLQASELVRCFNAAIYLNANAEYHSTFLKDASYHWSYKAVIL